MKRGFLREKAIFQILTLIIAVVSFSYALKPAEAATNTCCEKTLNEQYCFYGDSSNCDPAKQYASVSCEQTSFCQLGCCYDLDEGLCYRNVPQSKCLSTDGGEWYKDVTCNSVGSCRLGCCTIGSQCFMATEQSCAIQTAQYSELELDFSSDIATETECQNVCRAKEKGCCVNLDKSCAYETREACDTARGSFYNQQYCSDIALCGCLKHNKKECRDDDVYWLDSCGNLEDVAEDCDYSKGTICKKSGDDYTCGSTNCESTYSDEKNVHDPNMGGVRKNGESWCVYESGTGDYMDRPGTRHYRHMCVNGQEIIESCRDFREEVCAQGKVSGMTEAQCLHNDIYESPITEQISTVPRGFQFWEDKGDCDESTVDCTVVWLKKSRFK
ncbi:MAG: hypothetical protein Q8N77_04890, partial [Nanoarchaeota archaeon]|nr:hypothetical protein [Nanoarchaeota archaeon]